MKSNLTPEAVGTEVGQVRFNNSLTIHSESEYTFSLKSDLQYDAIDIISGKQY